MSFLRLCPSFSIFSPINLSATRASINFYPVYFDSGHKQELFVWLESFYRRLRLISGKTQRKCPIVNVICECSWFKSLGNLKLKVHKKIKFCLVETIKEALCRAFIVCYDFSEMSLWPGLEIFSYFVSARKALPEASEAISTAEKLWHSTNCFKSKIIFFITVFFPT